MDRNAIGRTEQILVVARAGEVHAAAGLAPLLLVLPGHGERVLLPENEMANQMGWLVERVSRM